MTQKALTRTEAERELCAFVYDEVQHGSNANQAAIAAGVSCDTALRWLRNPAKYDPYIDEVAMTRAMEGDRKVFERLTVWEREVLFDRLEKIKRELLPFEWAEYVEEYRRILGIPVRRINRALRARQ